MKRCITCKRNRPLSDFSFKNRKTKVRQRKCKKCYNEYSRWYYRTKDKTKQIKRTRNNARQRRLRFIEFKSQCKCQFCPENAPECLDFHHIDPKGKLADVSDMIYRVSEKRMYNEIKKCVVVCSNCHRKLHAGTMLPK